MKAKVHMVCQSSIFPTGLFFHLSKISLVLGLACLTSGCARAPRTDILDDSATRPFLSSGILSLTRAVPAQITLAQASVDSSETANEQSGSESAPLLGLLPGSVPMIGGSLEHTGAWLLVSRNANTVAVMDGNVTKHRFTVNGLNSLPKGVYSVLLKQRAPLWYAPDEYFTARNLAVPSAQDRARYLRGALGEFVIYLSKTIALYSGAIDVPEMAGARIDENTLSRLYYELMPGSPIEIQ